MKRNWAEEIERREELHSLKSQPGPAFRYSIRGNIYMINF
jgi:hypothetical protein